MKVNVVTQHGETIVEVDAWSADGALTLFKDGEEIAVLAEGFWHYVERLKGQEKKEPRAWSSLADVPHDVAVKDKDSDLYQYDLAADVWMWRSNPLTPLEVADYFDRYAPFVEVSV